MSELNAGTVVRVFGRIYIVTGVNYLGDYSILRFSVARRVWQRSSISANPLPKEHPHYWEIATPHYTRRLGRAVKNLQRLDPWPGLDEPARLNARRSRRAFHWMGILRRFFMRVQSMTPTALAGR